MPPTYITKYNRFVDNIIARINRILGKSYDPVRVRLHSEPKNTNKTTTTTTTTKKRKTTTKRKQPIRATNKMAEFDVARMTESESREPAFVLIAKNGAIESKPKNSTVQNRAPPKQNTKKGGGKTKAAKKNAKPRATLFGLSSIKRDGDVMVNMMANHTTVKSNFKLGPLTLRVEKEVGIFEFELNGIKCDRFLFSVWQRSQKRAEERNSHYSGDARTFDSENKAWRCGYSALDQSFAAETGKNFVLHGVCEIIIIIIFR